MQIKNDTLTLNTAPFYGSTNKTVCLRYHVSIYLGNPDLTSVNPSDDNQAINVSDYLPDFRAIVGNGYFNSTSSSFCITITPTALNPPPPDVACTAVSVANPLDPSDPYSVDMRYPFAVNVTFQNIGSGTAPPAYNGGPLSASMHTYNGQWYGNPPNSYNGWASNDVSSQVPNGIPPGGTVTVSVSLSPTNAISNYQLALYSDYANAMAMHDCPQIPIHSYEYFQLQPNPSASFVGDSEDPTGVNYNASVNNTATVPVNGSTTTSCFYKQPSSCTGPVLAGPTTRGIFNPGPNIMLGPGTYPIISPKAGDTYCTEIDLAYASAFVGPGGQDNIVQRQGGGSNVSKNCPSVANKPFFKVYGSSISSGGDFTTGGCQGGGELGGWFNSQTGAVGSPPYYWGSSTQLSALALLKITGVASAQTSYSRSPTELTFANSGTGVTTTPDTYSPALGGNYADPASYSRCFSDQSPPSGATGLSGSTSVTGLNGAYTASTPFAISGGTIGTDASGKFNNVSIFVNGNVYISNDITYQDTGWSIGNVPSFILHVTGGNIYIDNNVKTLDGIFTAAPDSSGNGGTIYTCGTSSYAGVDKSQLYDNCYNQLTVHGSFVARHVNLMRTYGSLRDEKPKVTPPTPPGSSPLGLYWSRANNGRDYCISIYESQDPYWTDGGTYPHYLCAPQSSASKLNWSYSIACWTPTNKCNSSQYPAADYSSVQLHQPPSSSCGDTSLCWTDNRLYNSAGLTFVFSGPPPSGTFCTAVPQFYAADQNAQYWQNAHICEPVNGSTTVQALGPPFTCSSSKGPTSNSTCAAEVFDFSPELYLSDPSIKKSDSSTGNWDSVTSLPPIL